MSNSRAEEKPSHEEPGSTEAAEGDDGQDQDGPATRPERTFLEHFEDSMNGHETLGRLLSQ